MPIELPIELPVVLPIVLPIGVVIGGIGADFPLFLKNKHVFRCTMGSGGLLGPSWTLPDTFWTILNFFKVLTKVVPEDL